MELPRHNVRSVKLVIWKFTATIAAVYGFHQVYEAIYSSLTFFSIGQSLQDR